jgi:hypothetical protein
MRNVIVFSNAANEGDKDDVSLQRLFQTLNSFIKEQSTFNKEQSTFNKEQSTFNEEVKSFMTEQRKSSELMNEEIEKIGKEQKSMSNILRSLQKSVGGLEGYRRNRDDTLEVLIESALEEDLISFGFHTNKVGCKDFYDAAKGTKVAEIDGLVAAESVDGEEKLLFVIETKQGFRSEHYKQLQDGVKYLKTLLPVLHSMTSTSEKFNAMKDMMLDFRHHSVIGVVGGAAVDEDVIKMAKRDQYPFVIEQPLSMFEVDLSPCPLFGEKKRVARGQDDDALAQRGAALDGGEE